MKGRHFGIFALALLPLLLTVPSAFADHDDTLIMSISDGIENLGDLKTVSDGNGFTIEDFDKATLEYNAAMAAFLDPDPEIHETAGSLLEFAETTHDGIYDQIYDEIEGQQAVRHDAYVINAQASLSFLIAHADSLELSEATVNQLVTTLAILESGTDAEIDAGTGQIGITLSVLPIELSDSLPSSFTTGSGTEEQLKAKLPPGILKKYGYSTDTNLSTESSDGTDGANGNDETNGFFSLFDNFGVASDNANSEAKGQGIGLGKIPWIFDSGFSPDDNAFAPPFSYNEDGTEEKFDGKAHGAKKRAEAQAKADEKSGGKSGGNGGQGQGGQGQGGQGQGGQGQGGQGQGGPPP